jgi:hypothetical protein
MTGFMGIGLSGLVPATVILAISFFVLYALENVRAGGLKRFGYIVVVLLWISALITVSFGIYTIMSSRSHVGEYQRETASEEAPVDPLRAEMRRQMQREMDSR